VLGTRLAAAILDEPVEVWPLSPRAAA
jgi:hypothetical protein